jgi:hypothetical protein
MSMPCLSGNPGLVSASAGRVRLRRFLSWATTLLKQNRWIQKSARLRVVANATYAEASSPAGPGGMVDR